MVELPYEERVNLFKKMIKEHKPWREISKRTGFGPNKVSSIKTDMEGLQGSPKQNQAYAMFNDTKSNYEVARALSLSEGQTTKFKREYLNLIEHDELEALYNRDDTGIQSILNLQAALTSNGISEQEYLGIIPEVCRKKELQSENNIIEH